MPKYHRKPINKAEFEYSYFVIFSLFCIRIGSICYADKLFHSVG